MRALTAGDGPKSRQRKGSEIERERMDLTQEPADTHAARAPHSSHMQLCRADSRAACCK